jgi:hypothetical protein
MSAYIGTCHCKLVRFSVTVDLLQARKAICNCSRCQSIGFLHCHVPEENFKLLSGSETMKEYRFGTRRAIHYFCQNCGIESFYRSRSDPTLIDINIRCLEGVDFYSLDYWLVDGQNWEDSQRARREFETSNRLPVLWRILAPSGVFNRVDAGLAFFESWH